MTPFNPDDYLILVIDDISKNIQLVVEILDEQGYGTTFATNGQQALERAKTTQPDLILLDLMMPEMSGLQVCEKLKIDPLYAEIPVIFLTASTEDDDLVEAFQLGAVDYVTKPFKAVELLARVRNHLELKRTRDELKQAYKELEKLANTDPLTGIANRRALFEFAEYEFHRTQRYQKPFSVLILDLDHFKHINDNYGHDIGDEALKITARTIEQSLRKIDKVGRFGGEEFVVILPETKIQEAHIVAERIRKEIAELSLTVKNQPITITASIGIASYHSDDNTIDMILKRADQGLFMAKAQGRNRVIINDGSLKSKIDDDF